MRFVVAILAILCCGAAPPGAVQVGGCSGTLVYRDLERTLGVSVAHCSGKLGSTVLVVLQDGRLVPGVWLAVDAKSDLSLFSIPQGSHSLATVPLTRSDKGAVSAYGRNGLKQLKATGPEGITDTKSGKLYQRMGYRVRDGRYRDGDSGAGVYVGTDLVGVASHGEDDEELFASSHAQLVTFLKAHKAFGRGPEGSDWGDKDRTREILELKRRLAGLEVVIKNLKAKPGAAGVAGPVGPAGLAGQAGPQGPPGTAADTSGLSSRLESLELWRKDFRATVRIRLRPVKE